MGLRFIWEIYPPPLALVAGCPVPRNPAMINAKEPTLLGAFCDASKFSGYPEKIRGC
jgi:hypothetical protein